MRTNKSLISLIVIVSALAACGLLVVLIPSSPPSVPVSPSPASPSPAISFTATAATPTIFVPPTAMATAAPTWTGIVYFFFSTTCEHCAAQAPIMEQFHRDNPNIRVIGVPLYADQAGADAFAALHGLTFEMREDKSLVSKLGTVTVHPVIAFQSVSGGPLVRASNGVISEQDLNEAFEKFIAGGTVQTIQSYG